MSGRIYICREHFFQILAIGSKIPVSELKLFRGDIDLDGISGLIIDG
jgi:hypothetical protein